MRKIYLFSLILPVILLSFATGDAGEKKPGDRNRSEAKRYRRDAVNLVKRYGKSQGKKKAALDAHIANRQALDKLCEELAAARDAGEKEKVKAGDEKKRELDAKGRRTWETFRARESEAWYLDDQRHMKNWKRGVDEYSQKKFDEFLASRKKASESWDRLAVAIQEGKPWHEIGKLRIMAEANTDRSKLLNAEFDTMKESGKMLRETKKLDEKAIESLTPALDAIDKKTKETFSKRQTEVNLKEEGRLLEADLRDDQKSFWKACDEEKKRFKTEQDEKKKIAAAKKAAEDKKRKEEAAKRKAEEAKRKAEEAKRKKEEAKRKKAEAKLDKMPLEVETEAR